MPSILWNRWGKTHKRSYRNHLGWRSSRKWNQNAGEKLGEMHRYEWRSNSIECESISSPRRFFLKLGERRRRPKPSAHLPAEIYVVLQSSIIVWQQRGQDQHLPSLGTCTSMYGTALEPVYSLPSIAATMYLPNAIVHVRSMRDAFVKGQWGWTQTVASPQNVFHMKPNPLGHIDQRTGGGCRTARVPRHSLVRIRLPAYKTQ